QGSANKTQCIQNHALRSFAAADFPITSFDLGIDLLNQRNLLADPSHNAQMVYALGFVSGFGAHAPSLPDIPKNRYLKVRKVGLIVYLTELEINKENGDVDEQVQHAKEEKLKSSIEKLEAFDKFNKTLRKALLSELKTIRK